MAKIEIQDSGLRHLEFCQSEILGYSNTYMANICQCIDFDKNIFIYDRDIESKIQDGSRGVKVGFAHVGRRLNYEMPHET